MPGGFLDGGAPTQDDVLAVAHHLSGRFTLPEARRQRADLDVSGDVDASDLLLMARLAAGELTAPISRPSLVTALPAIVSHGAELALSGDDFGTTTAELVVAFRGADAVVHLTPTGLTGGTVRVTTPAAAQIGTGPAQVELIRDGVRSNTLGVQLLARPLIGEIVFATDAADSGVVLHGEGFTDGTLTVRIGNDVIPAQVEDDTRVRVDDLPPLTEVTPVTVTVGGEDSNTLLLRPRTSVDCQVVLPPASPYDVASLTVVGGTLQSGSPAPDGTFAAVAAAATSSAVHVLDGNDVVLAGLQIPGTPCLIDAASTAAWLITVALSSLNGLMDVGAEVVLHADHPALVALASAIATTHAQFPHLGDMVAVDDVASAMTDATTAMTAILGAQSGLGS